MLLVGAVVSQTWRACYSQVSSNFELAVLPSTTQSERERLLHFVVVGGGSVAPLVAQVHVCSPFALLVAGCVVVLLLLHWPLFSNCFVSG
jgi:hypothetical protein